MNTTFLTWLTVAAVVGGGLLLFLGMPASESAAPLVLENIPAETPAAVESHYWEPVTPVAATPVTMQYVATRSQPVQPCGSCYPASVVPIHRQYSQAQPCGTCGSPQPAVPIYMQYPQVPSCEQRVPIPCGPVPCSSLPAYCGAYCGTPCGSTCPLSKPGINRNMELCLDECTFVQLHTTIPHPICWNVCFEWSASKGSFLDPTASDPIYYVPNTQFPNGEDVWIVVTITDGTGAKYTDQLQLHVVNSR